jgi:hypothetical protein
VELIKGDFSLRACSISITKPSRHQIEKGLLKQKNSIFELASEDDGVYDFRFRQAFATEMAKKPFPIKSSTLDNACIDAPVWNGPDKSWIPVNEIYIYEPGVFDRAYNFFTTFSFSALKAERQLWARKGPDQAEVKDEPAPNTPPTVKPPETKQAAGCVTTNEESPAQKALRTLLSEGFIGDEETRSLYAGWCEVEEKFYQTLRGSDSQRYQLIRFIRSSITGIDICWSASEAYRKKNFAEATQCAPRLNQPRNFARALPFVTKPEQKAAVLHLLTDNTVAVRREVEGLLRLYPHDAFHAALKENFADWINIPPDTRQAIALAAVGYYYNRIIEQQWVSPADGVESAWNAATGEIDKAAYWIDKLTGPDRVASRARLSYARAHVLLKVTSEKPPPPTDAKIRADFQQLISMGPDDILAYPLPPHIARAFAYLKGTPNDRRLFAQINGDKLQGRNGGTVRVDTITDDPMVFSVPNTDGTVLTSIKRTDSVRVIIHFEDAVAAKTGADKNIWEFVSTSSSVLGWIKRIKSQS